MSQVLLAQGDARQIPLADGSVHCVVTSPPYWRKRDYGIDEQLGMELLHDCNGAFTGDNCGSCYICHLRQVMREVWRVLRDDGTLWLNIGDSYAASGGGAHKIWHKNPGYSKSFERGGQIHTKWNLPGLKPKDLCGIPWRLALALQTDGWTLRSEILWHKVNPMPECLDPATQIFIRQGNWVSRITLGQLALLPTLPEILGPQGWVRILNVWHTTKPAIAIEAGKVEHVICSPEHRFPISSDRRRQRVTEKEAADIRHEGYADYFLYCPIGRFLAPSLHTWMGRNLNTSLGYLLGVYAAEGGHDGERGFRVKFTIGAHEDVFATDIRTAFKECDLAPSEWADTSSRTFRISEEWFTRTVDTFITGNVKTKALNIEMILNCPQPFRQAFLQGYVDGDGTKRLGGGWGATSTSQRLRDDIATLASSVGIITSKGYGEQHDKRTDTTYAAHGLWTPYMTKRKTKSGMEGIFQVPPRARRSLEGLRDMIDIEVEGGLFLIGDGLVTHNSVQDRPTRAHEQIFLFSKRERYFYDSAALAEPCLIDTNGSSFTSAYDVATKPGLGQGPRQDTPTRNTRSVWSMPAEPGSYAHFATMPTELARRCILAGTSAYGVCDAPITKLRLRRDLPREAHEKIAKFFAKKGLSYEHAIS